MASSLLSIKPYAHTKLPERIIPATPWLVRLKQTSLRAGMKLQRLGRRLEKVSPWYEPTERNGRLVMFS
jgi:hypothetical protein